MEILLSFSAFCSLCCSYQGQPCWEMNKQVISGAEEMCPFPASPNSPHTCLLMSSISLVETEVITYFRDVWKSKLLQKDSIESNLKRVLITEIFPFLEKIGKRGAGGQWEFGWKFLLRREKEDFQCSQFHSRATSLLKWTVVELVLIWLHADFYMFKIPRALFISIVS